VVREENEMGKRGENGGYVRKVVGGGKGSGR